MALDRIIVGIDFSPISAGALRYARRLVGPGVTLRLLHVVDARVLALGPVHRDAAALMSLREKLALQARELLEGVARPEGGAGPPLAVEVAFGRPADAIVAASQHDADLVVLGGTGHGAIERLLHGCVVEEVARRGAVPTLAVPEGSADVPVERVLVAVDYLAPAPSIEALRVGQLLEKRLGVSLEVVHTVELPPPIYVPILAAEGISVPLAERVVTETERALTAFVTATLARRDVRAHVLIGSPSSEISRFATSRDLLVCGTHARGTLGRLAFGSVATRLLRQAPCALVVVRPLAEEAAP